MMVTATPKTKPVTTGLARNSEMKPSRANPAITRMAPTMSASAALRATNWAGSPPASGATSDSDITAMVELVVTRRWRLVPKTA
jgi:hypothetical protein